VLRSAVEHTRDTGHVIALNGTIDQPAAENIEVLRSAHSENQRADQMCYVDIPTEDCVDNEDGAWKNVAQCPTRKEAIDFAREHFGADDQGRICLISG
jgi:hypothetical protein